MPKMTELKLSRHHRTDRELCYHRQRGQTLLYDDTAMPRQIIATISGRFGRLAVARGLP